MGDLQDDLTIWLKRMSAGDETAANHVASVVYQEMRRQATLALSRESRNQSLQPTLLVNDAFLRLIKGRPIDWQDRSHFFNLTAKTMRRIVVDHFRQQNASKRPRPALAVPLEEAIVFDESRRDEALMIDESLEYLTEVHPRAAQVLSLWYFGGLRQVEIANLVGISDRQVKRDLREAELCLRRYFGIGSGGKRRGKETHATGF
jgi:RNA polymerase sigma factor (TIGR02999 family)